MAALKEASGSLDQMIQISRLCGGGLSLLSGDDALTLPLLAIGGQGVVSVLSNLMPKEVGEVCRAWFKGDHKKAWKLHAALQPITKAMFMEPNPAPVKAALALKGIIKDDAIRLPMCGLSDGGRETLQDVMSQAGIL